MNTKGHHEPSSFFFFCHISISSVAHQMPGDSVKMRRKPALHINVVVTMISCISHHFIGKDFRTIGEELERYCLLLNDLHRDGMASLNEWKILLLGMLPAWWWLALGHAWIGWIFAVWDEFRSLFLVWWALNVNCWGGEDRWSTETEWCATNMG